MGSCIPHDQTWKDEKKKKKIGVGEGGGGNVCFDGPGKDSIAIDRNSFTSHYSPLQNACSGFHSYLSSDE